MPTRPSALIIPILCLVVLFALQCGQLPALAQSASSGSAQASTGTSGPGRLVTPADRERAQANQPPPGWAFDATPPSDAESRRAGALLAGKDPRRLILELLQGLNPPAGPPGLSRGTLTYAGATDVWALFPHHLIYVLRFRQWPLSALLPAPIESNNLFAIDQSGEVLLINHSSQLSDFFTASVRGIKSGAQAYAVADAWILLSEELVQDGMFQFAEPEISVSDVAGLSVRARARVRPSSGDQGELTVGIEFNADGGIASINAHNAVRAGVRPQ